MYFGTDTPAFNVSNDIVTQGQVKAIQILAATLTGESPIVENHGSYVDLVFSPSQINKMQGWIKTSLTGAPGPIHVDMYGIFVPPLFQVYGKIAILALVAAFLFGRISKM